jgi:hypothetical protein
MLRAIAVLGCVALGGCAGGDFGRTRSTFVTDDMHAWIGVEATGSIGKPASNFALTDSERQLRDLAYPYIEPPRDRPFWAGVFGDYAPIPAPWRQSVAFDKTAYGRKLLADKFFERTRSQASRYAKLIDDIRDDITRYEPFMATAVTVADMDAKRRASLNFVAHLSPGELQDAKARMKENELIVKWVHRCLQQRIASYKWALERLVISQPDPAAAEADRVLSLLMQTISAPAMAGPRPGDVVVAKG